MLVEIAYDDVSGVQAWLSIRPQQRDTVRIGDRPADQAIRRGETADLDPSRGHRACEYVIEKGLVCRYRLHIAVEVFVLASIAFHPRCTCMAATPMIRLMTTIAARAIGKAYPSRRAVI